MTPRGLEVVMHQSLPNGNLGSLLYLVVCSSLPENPDAWTAAGNAATAQAAATGEPKQPPVKFASFTEKEGPCADVAAFSMSGNQEQTVGIGKDIKGVCKFRCEEFFGKPMINANISVKNVSKERRGCQYYVAFFDKNGKLIGCAGQQYLDMGLAPGEETSFGSCLIFLPVEQIKKIASYKARLYETDKLPESKK